MTSIFFMYYKFCKRRKTTVLATGMINFYYYIRECVYFFSILKSKFASKIRNENTSETDWA